MKTKDFRSMSILELRDKLAELQKELIKLNAQIATKTALKNPSEVKNVKKGIAKIKSLISEKEQGGMKKK